MPSCRRGNDARIDQRLRAHAHRFADLRAHFFRGVGAHHGAERRRGIERIAEPVVFRELDEAFDEGVENVALHVNALDRAARLAGVEERAVDEVLDRRGERRIGAHVSGVLAAELEAGRDEALARGALHGVPAADRPGERDERDALVLDHARHLLVIEVQELEHAFGQAAPP